MLEGCLKMGNGCRNFLVISQRRHSFPWAGQSWMILPGAVPFESISSSGRHPVFRPIRSYFGSACHPSTVHRRVRFFLRQLGPVYSFSSDLFVNIADQWCYKSTAMLLRKVFVLKICTISRHFHWTLELSSYQPSASQRLRLVGSQKKIERHWKKMW